MFFQTVVSLDPRVTALHNDLLDRVAALSTSLATTEPTRATTSEQTTPDPTPSILPRKRYTADDDDVPRLPATRNHGDDNDAGDQPPPQPTQVCFIPTGHTSAQQQPSTSSKRQTLPPSCTHSRSLEHRHTTMIRFCPHYNAVLLVLQVQ